MWLVNCTTLRLEYFVGSNIPKYAILSHTWEDDEVTFQELAQPLAARKKGHIKITETCVRARRHGLQYAWIDTCCIDKASSAELSESINSMFQWYKNAEICYVFLSDFRPGTPAEYGLAACRWFSRGWTLQELIAPTDLRFYDQKWSFIGTKNDFFGIISSITGIDRNLLLGYYHPKVYSVATRMSWAASRKTTRTEDLAYCLLGIFDVNMPMIYGEGLKAFRRLQEEIIKHSNDLTVFAWDQKEEERVPFGLFALSPAAFADANGIKRFSRAYMDPVFALTNKGLKFDNFQYIWKEIDKKDNNEIETTVYRIPLAFRRVGDRLDEITMQLRKIGPNLFSREGTLFYGDYGSGHGHALVTLLNFYLQATPSDPWDFHTSCTWKCHFPRQDKVQILEAIPESHWNDTDQSFFLPLDDSRLVLAASCVIKLDDSEIQLVVCIDVENNWVPNYRIFNAANHNRQSSWLFRHKKLWGRDVTWDDIEAEAPEIFDFTNMVEVSLDGRPFGISVSNSRGIIPSISEEEIHSANFKFETLAESSLDPVPWFSQRRAASDSFDVENIGPSSRSNQRISSSSRVQSRDQWGGSGELGFKDSRNDSSGRSPGRNEVDSMYMQMGGLTMSDRNVGKIGFGRKRK